MTSLKLTAAPRLSVETTFGALLVGTFVSLILYGLATHQAYRYYRLYPKDGLALKYTVTVLWVFDTLHSIFCIHACYYYLVLHYFEPLALLHAVWSLSATIATGACVTFVTNGFYVRRIYILGNQNIILTCVTVALPIVQLGLAIAAFLISALHRNFADYPRFSWLITATLSVSVATDLVLTASITWFLHRSRTGFSKTNTVIDKLMMYAVGTGLLTSLVGLICLICVAVMPDSFIYMAVHFVLKKLYLNSLLVWLNSRKSSVDGVVATFNEPISYALRSSTTIHDHSNSAIGSTFFTSQDQQEKSFPSVLVPLRRNRNRSSSVDSPAILRDAV